MLAGRCRRPATEMLPAPAPRWPRVGVQSRPMAPRRADYKTRKEYRWAKKVEQREHIANAPSIPGAIIVSCIVWFALVALGGIIAGGGGGAVMVFVGIPIAVVFYKKCAPTINRVWDTKAIAEKQRQNRQNR